MTRSPIGSPCRHWLGNVRLTARSSDWKKLKKLPIPCCWTSPVAKGISGVRQLWPGNCGMNWRGFPITLMLKKTLKKGTGPDCRNGPRGAAHNLDLSPFSTRIAVADTIGAAWAMAHFGVSTKNPIAIIPVGQHQGTLRPLPVAGLRLSPQILDTLRKLDLNCIGQVENLPRSTLPARFGKELLRRLDQAWGTLHELITPERLQEPLCAVWNFEECLRDRQTLELVARQLLDRVLAQLNPRQAGIRELQCHLQGSTDRLTLTLRLLQPTLDPRHLWDLLRLEWDRQEAAIQKSGAAPRCLDEGIHCVRMEVAEAAPLKIRQQTLFDVEPGQKEAVAFQQFVERLGSRLGNQAVLRVQPAPDAQPEYACDYVAWIEDSTQVGKGLNESSVKSRAALVSRSDTAPFLALARTRPLRLFARPEPLRILTPIPSGPPRRMWWGNRQLDIVRAWGPERIETGWWRDDDIRRDYYRLETDRRDHLWIFHCLQSDQWYIQGTYE